MILIKDKSNINITKSMLGTDTQIWFKNCKNIRLDGLNFDGKRRNLPSMPVEEYVTHKEYHKPTVVFESCSDVTVTNCKFFDARWDHLYMVGYCFNIKVLGCFFEDAYRNGITLINASAVEIAGNIINLVDGLSALNDGQDGINAGIDLEGNEDHEKNYSISIHHNQFRHCRESGVRVTKGHGAVAEDVDVMYNEFIQTPMGTMVAGMNCRIIGNRYNGYSGRLRNDWRGQVRVAGINDYCTTTIRDNYFQDLLGINSHVTWRGRVIITDNILENMPVKPGSPGIGIMLYSPNAVVSQNQLYDIGAYGIAVDASGAIITNNVLRGGGITGISGISDLIQNNNIIQGYENEVVLK